jgi:hypothetical protein
MGESPMPPKKSLKPPIPQSLNLKLPPVGYNGHRVTTHSLFRPEDLAGADAQGAAERYCLGCGYNLRGLAGARCPECGRNIDRHEHDGLNAPWVHRSRLGVMAAYWQTAALVTFRPGDFAARFYWPRVRFHGSHLFRWWTVGWAGGSIVLAAAAMAWRLGMGPFGLAVLCGALAPSAALFVYGATELAGFFVGPRLASDTSEEVFRAQMINDYASAALAWTPVPAVVLCAGIAAGRLFAAPVDQVLFLVSAALAAWVGVLWLGGVLVLFGRSLGLGAGLLVLAAVMFPVRFVGLAILTALFIFAPLACAVSGLMSFAR